MVDTSGLRRILRTTRKAAQGDFRGSSWGAEASEVEAAEFENLREGWTGSTTLFGYEAQLRYVFGSSGLQSGNYEFSLQSREDASAAFQKVLDALMRQLGLPLYLQRTPAALPASAILPPTSLLRSMAKGSNRCIAAWATDSTEILLIKGDEAAVPLRLLYLARSNLLYA
jgi:hypothetical protein